MADWTDEHVDMLKILHKEGHSFNAIARMMGGGMTRSACMGKARRLGLAVRAAPTTIKAQPQPAPAPKRHNDGVMAPPMVLAPAPKNEPPPIGPVRDFPPAGTCRFIRAEIATGVDWRCCGAPAPEFSRPYCSYHLPRVYQAAPKRQQGIARKLEAAE